MMMSGGNTDLLGSLWRVETILWIQGGEGNSKRLTAALRGEAPSVLAEGFVDEGKQAKKAVTSAGLVKMPDISDYFGGIGGFFPSSYSARSFDASFVVDAPRFLRKNRCRTNGPRKLIRRLYLLLRFFNLPTKLTIMHISYEKNLSSYQKLFLFQEFKFESYN